LREVHIPHVLTDCTRQSTSTPFQINKLQTAADVLCRTFSAGAGMNAEAGDSVPTLHARTELTDAANVEGHVEK
jgi:hypothetical protein